MKSETFSSRKSSKPPAFSIIVLAIFKSDRLVVRSFRHDEVSAIIRGGGNQDCAVVVQFPQSQPSGVDDTPNVS